MLGIFNKILDANKAEIQNLQKSVDAINKINFTKISDAELKAKTTEFKARFAKGESLDSILNEGFALVKEAFSRVMGITLHDVQLIAAIAVHKGGIAEQRTGEGKTFSVVPAIYLNALTEKGVHVVTVNDYLARRDAGWVAPIFDLLGVSVATIIHDTAMIYDPEFKNQEEDERLSHLRVISRKEAYGADVTYGTNNEFGFDYLRDNMQNSLEAQVQRGHHFAIVDEVDSILIDEARTPLIISAPGQEPTQKYTKFAKIIEELSEESDYVVDEKLRTAHLTELGTVKIEKILGVENLYEKDFSILHHLEESLKARALFVKDRDYVVRDDEVIIVDEFTGRLMPGRRYSEGLHQAIEAKENVTIQQESKTLATVSLQNYFRMYQKLSGMTGTAATEAEEFHKIYHLNVLVIPTHIPMKRKDRSDVIYKTISAKYTAVAEEIAKVHETGQPILVGTTSIEKNEFLSELLKRKKISHALLNAKNHEKEAEIIAAAGQAGAVTVATNLAGRGVDIKLGEGVDKLGGLYVLGTERHESRRIDNQLRGRSGRQGDPGISQFFVSMEDDLMRIFGGEQIANLMTALKVPEDTPIQNPLVSRALEGAQKKVEGQNFDARKHTVEYDDVMNQQRQIIYGVRQKILEISAGVRASFNDEESEVENKTGLNQEILTKIDNEIGRIIRANSEAGIDHAQIVAEFNAMVNFDEASLKNLEKDISSKVSEIELAEFLSNLARELYEAKEQTFGKEVMRALENQIYLGTMDQLWMEHLDTVDDLRSGIGLRAYAQRDPLIEYKKEAFDLFDRLMQTIDDEITHRIYKVAPMQGFEVPAMQEMHTEALDQDEFLKELEKMSQGEVSPDTKVKVERVEAPVVVDEAPTKVKIERPGQEAVVELSANGMNTKSHADVGRNDPCWCGSGKKYKKCHWPN